MTRISRVKKLQPLQLAVSSLYTAPRAPFLLATRTISATATVRNSNGSSSTKSTEWVRGKLWKGEAPGAEDPYTQRSQAEDTTLSSLPRETLHHLEAEGGDAREQQHIPYPLRESRLVLPARRSEAETPGEVQSTSAGYVPAETIDELEVVAPLNKWWDQPGHWGAESDFKGFGASGRISEREVVEVYLRQAVVEMLALKGEGVFGEWALKKWRAGGRAELNEALAVAIDVAEGGAATLRGASAKGLVDRLTGKMSEAEQPVASERVSVEEAREMIKAWEDGWKDIVLDDSAKFAVCVARVAPPSNVVGFRD